MANPFNPSGGNPAQTSLPNMGSPFAQNPQQHTNPFMGSEGMGGANNASNSPFAGAGFNNPFGGEHAGSGNPFGGGQAGGGMKGLIDSNNKLIQAINKLTTIFEKLVGKMGGTGGMGGGMAGIGGAFGAVTGHPLSGLFGGDTLQAQQLSRLTGYKATSTTNPFQASGNMPQVPQSSIFGRGEMIAPTGNAQLDAFNQQMNQGFQRDFERARNTPPPLTPQQQQQQAAGGYFGTGYGGRFNPIFGQGQPTLSTDESLQQMNDFYNARDTARAQFRHNVSQFATNTAKQAGAMAFNLGVNIGSTGTIPQMLSQIPYIGGLLAIPYATLDARINQFAPGEATARLVAQQGGLGQGGNYFATHRVMFDKFKELGLDPNSALQEALGYQEAAGLQTGMDPNNIMGNRLSQFVGAGYTGQTVGSFQRLNRADRMIKFDPANLFNYGLSMGLGDQGMMELLGAAEGLQNLAPGMGYRGNAARILGQAANNTNNGFIGTQGFLQATRQIQATAETGSGLKGIFGGLAETLTMASFLAENGDITQAIRNFETGYATDPAALKGRLTKQFGAKITEMGMLSKMTSADYDNIGQGQFAQGTLPGAQTGDIVLSKQLIKGQIERGNDLYANRLGPAQDLIELNRKLEQTIVEGVSQAVLQTVGPPLIDLAKNMQNMANNLSTLLPYVIQGVDYLARFFAWATSWLRP